MPDIAAMIPLCHTSDIADNQARGFVIAGSSLFVVRREDGIYVYRNSCPHLGVELNWVPDQFLDRDGTLIMCSTHGALFEIETGDCIAGPCAGDALEEIPHQVVDGMILIAPPLPRT